MMTIIVIGIIWCVCGYLVQWEREEAADDYWYSTVHNTSDLVFPLHGWTLEDPWFVALGGPISFLLIAFFDPLNANLWGVCSRCRKRLRTTKNRKSSTTEGAAS